MTTVPTMKQFRAMIAVSQTGSFVRAAELLSLSQPALSETISQLERVVGGRVFQRTTRTVVITPFGEALLPRARKLLDDIDTLCHDMRELAELQRGTVSVGCLTSIASNQLPRIILAFRQDHPKIRVRVRDENAAGLHERLLAGDIDFAITSRLDSAPGEISFQPLLADPFRLLCPANHPLAQRAEVAWRDVAEHFYLGWSEETANHFAIASALTAASIELRPHLEVAQLGTMLSMVAHGVGVAAVPRLACPQTPEVRAVRLVEPQISRDVGVATHPRRPQTLAATRFIAMATEWMTAHDPAPPLA